MEFLNMIRWSNFWHITVMLLLISTPGIWKSLFFPFVENLFSSSSHSISSFHALSLSREPFRPRFGDIFTHRAVDDKTERRVQPWTRRYFKCKFIQLWNGAVMVHDKVYFLSEWTARLLLTSDVIGWRSFATSSTNHTFTQLTYQFDTMIGQF